MLRMRLSLLLRDVRHAWRPRRRPPAFPVVAILTLALGIGTTTAVFTVVNGVLLQPLPYRDPGRLVMLFYGHHGRVSPWRSPPAVRDYAGPAAPGGVSPCPPPPDVRDYVGPSAAFIESSSVVPITANMTGAGDPERLQG